MPGGRQATPAAATYTPLGLAGGSAAPQLLQSSRKCSNETRAQRSARPRKEAALESQLWA
ncbi:hypothetical protein USDA257_c48630 [Sinorhizobium fredii USDA 257]|uniref:Uncharacterized protein n=1 Tax=Sinorhizobium fredii (strain USDA 257) TaxID=1185652 RepID=I3XBZ2_SINF2|nr:hypothetical protein USDA257_c48630 [Sinorhizobium fredii USDA 257]